MFWREQVAVPPLQFGVALTHGPLVQLAAWQATQRPPWQTLPLPQPPPLLIAVSSQRGVPELQLGVRRMQVSLAQPATWQAEQRPP